MRAVMSGATGSSFTTEYYARLGTPNQHTGNPPPRSGFPARRDWNPFENLFVYVRTQESIEKKR
jgi:hypothetical protein